MSDWYTPSGWPANRAFGASASARSELTLIETAMAKLPTLTGNGGKVVAVNSGGTALESLSSMSVAQGGTGATTLTDGGILLGSGTGAVSAMSVLADGELVIGDGTTDPVALAAFTSSTGLLKHESGGLEANIAGVIDGDFIVGTGTGTVGLESGATARTTMGLGSIATQAANAVNIDGGTIDGATIATSDVTVGAGKTLDVSAGTLTLANNQISGDKISGGTIDTVTVVVANNTVTTAASGNLTSTELNAALAELQTDIDGLSGSDLADHIADTTTHGTTGDIVGTSDTQTLTNKTIVVASNTVTTAVSGNLTSTELNAALAELQTDIDTRQVSDAELTAIAGLTSAADKGIQFTGAGTAATYDLTTAGKALLDDASASAQRTTLGLAIGSDVMAYDATMLVDADIGVNVQAYDATLLVDADIGVNVQAFHANLADVAAITQTKGDLLVSDGTDIIDLAVGTNDYVLTADSAEGSGVKWAAAGGSGAWTLIEAWTPTAVNSKDFTWDETIYDDVRIVLGGIGPASDNVTFMFRLGYNNGATFYAGAADYGHSVVSMSDATRNAQGVTATEATLTYEATTGAALGVGNGTTEGISGHINLTGGGSVTSSVAYDTNAMFCDSAGRSRSTHLQGALMDGGGRANAMDSIRLLWASGNFKTSGTVYVYGLKRA